MSSQYQPRVLFGRKQVADTVKKLASQIEEDYQDKNPLLVGILRGSFVFMADLVRHLDFPLSVEFVTLSSYCGKKTSGKITVVQGLCSEVKGRDILVVEDIVDTGLTSAFFLEYLRKKKPASLRLCSLTDKPERREVAVQIDYLGFTVPDKFIVGYGLDWKQQYRQLPDICFLDECED